MYVLRWSKELMFSSVYISSPRGSLAETLTHNVVMTLGRSSQWTSDDFFYHKTIGFPKNMIIISTQACYTNTTSTIDWSQYREPVNGYEQNTPEPSEIKL